MRSIIKLTRIEHGILAGLIVVATYTLCGGRNSIDALFLFLSTLLAEVFLFVTNDIHNIEEDRINRPDAPLVRGDVSLVIAWAISVVSVLLSIIINIIGILFFKLNPLSALILVIALIMGYSYNYYVKKIIFLNNVFVSVTSSLTFLYGLYSVKASFYVLPYALFIISTLATMGREIIKGALDIKGDLMAGVRTVANTYGMNTAVRMALVFTSLAIASSVLLIIYSLNLSFGFVFMVGVLMTDILFVYLNIAIIRKGSDYLERFRSGALMAMSITIIAYLITALLQIIA